MGNVASAAEFTLYLPEVDTIEAIAAAPYNPNRLRANSCIMTVEDNPEVYGDPLAR